MGERDTRLNREVAQAPAPDFSADADRLARFTREAQTLDTQAGVILGTAPSSAREDRSAYQATLRADSKLDRRVQPAALTHRFPQISPCLHDQ